LCPEIKKTVSNGRDIEPLKFPVLFFGVIGLDFANFCADINEKILPQVCKLRLTCSMTVYEVCWSIKIWF